MVMLTRALVLAATLSLVVGPKPAWARAPTDHHTAQIERPSSGCPTPRIATGQ
jgi:hypothetical protein